MSSRFIITGVYLVLIVALVTCATDAFRHRGRALGKFVAVLDVALIPPILGNAIIIISKWPVISAVGFYTYFVGMDLAMFALMRFAEKYCSGSKLTPKARRVITNFFGFLLGLDAVQLLLNPLTHHAFDIVAIEYDRSILYILEPLEGQIIHRIIDYVVFVSVILYFTVSTVTTSRLYREKYSIILASIVITGLWETFYIFSDDRFYPIDFSMFGFTIFGVVAYYFAMHYRPLRLLDRMLSGIISNDDDACFIFSPRDRCIWVNKVACTLVGVQEDDCEKAKELLEYLFDTNLRKGNWTERHVTGAGDSMKYFLLENRDVINDNGKFSGYYLKISDITNEQIKIRRDLYEATHDSLTGLYTKDFLFKKIEHTLKDHPDTRYVVLHVNIKNFKVVNDIFGNDFGDYAIRSYADKKMSQFSGRCVYGRLGGANFGVLIPGDEFDTLEVDGRFDRLDVKKGNAKYPLQVQIGAYEVDRSVTDVNIMFANARLALTMIENDDSSCLAFYDEELRNEILWNQEINSQLANAIKNREIRPYLQPIADRDGVIVGCEALVRWVYKDQGVLPPFKFIPSLEKNGMIAEVDKYMWRCACEILAKWKQRGWNLFISVNISPKDFYYIDVPEYLKSLIDEYHLDPKQLRVEITESIMVSDTEKTIDIMGRLRNYGFIVEMDDFGSGYSSLNMLKNMPVDVLKIDMKFLGKSDDTQKADTIVKNIINLSMELGITSLTEGVETQSQYNILSDMGCKLFQGYYFSRPVPTEEFEELVIEKN